MLSVPPRFGVCASAGPASMAAVRAVAFSPEGRSVVSGGDKPESDRDYTLKLWNVFTGELVRTFEGQRNDVMSVAFSPDGRTVLSGGIDESGNSLKLWDVATGRLLRTFKSRSSDLRSVAFSPDGRTVLSGGGNEENAPDFALKLWDVATGKLVRALNGHTSTVSSVAFSPDIQGRLILSGSHDGTLKLWDVSTGKEIKTFKHHLNVPAFRKSNCNTVSDWTGHPDVVSSVRFSPDGRTVLSGGWNHTLKLWDVVTLKLVRTFEGHSDGVHTVASSPNGSTVLSAGADKTLKLWDASNGRLVRIFKGHFSEVRSVAFSPNGATALSGGGDPEEGCDYTLKLWDVATGRLLRTFKGHEFWVNSVAFSPDSRTVLSGSLYQPVMSGGRKDALLKLWDVATGKVVRSFEGHLNDVYSVAFSPDGRTMVSGSSDNTLKLWDVATGKLLRTLEGHSNTVSSVAFSPGGHTILSGSWDHSLKLWEVATGKLIHTFEGHLDHVNSVAFSPDGRTVLSGGSDRTLKLWDVTTGELMRTFDGHRDTVTSVAFSASGHSLLSGSWDGTVRVWSLSNGDEMLRLLGTPNEQWLAITPEGFFSASQKVPDSISIVRGLEVFSVDQFFQSLYRPDLVHQKLSGEFDAKLRVELAASKLDLEKVLKSGAAPTITIVSPKSESEIHDDKVAVDVSLVDEGGGVGRIEWRVNGVTRGVQKPETPNVLTRGATSVQHALALGEGANVIEVVAYNSSNLIASLPRSVAITSKPVTPRPRPRLYVLPIGVDNYFEKIGRLRFARADARAIAAAFRIPNLGTDLYERVIVHPPLLDTEVTIERLRALFEELKRTIRPEDVFVLYMSGHGATEDGRYYFIPQDVKEEDFALQLKQSINQDQLQEWLTEIPALRSVLIYDTCESGSATEERSGFRGDQRLVAVEKLSQSTGRTILAATTDTAPAKEGYKNHGVFTYAILDGLALADSNNSGRIKIGELGDYLKVALPELSKKAKFGEQVPQVNITGSNFALVNRATAAEIDAVRN